MRQVVSQHDPRLELIGQDRHLVRAIPRIHLASTSRGFIADEEVPKRKAPRTLNCAKLSNTTAPPVLPELYLVKLGPT